MTRNIKLAAKSLPFPGIPLRVKLKDGDSRWLDAYMREADGDTVYWEIWLKSAVWQRGIVPGDVWKPLHGNDKYMVERFMEAAP